MAGAIAEDRESCQFPFLLDEKPTVVPLRLDRRAVGRSARGTLWRRHRKSRKRQVAALFGQARRKQPVSRIQALNLFLVHPSSSAHCPAEAPAAPRKFRSLSRCPVFSSLAPENPRWQSPDCLCRNCGWSVDENRVSQCASTSAATGFQRHSDAIKRERRGENHFGAFRRGMRQEILFRSDRSRCDRLA